MTIQPFAIAIPQDRIDKLRRKLEVTTWPDELDGAGWDYGAPLEAVKRIANHWQHHYDWTAQEQHINEALPQFTADIAVENWGSFNVHFVHKRSTRKNAIPLLFCHGCV